MIFMFSRQLWEENRLHQTWSFEDSVLIDPPFWDHLNIEMYFSFLF